MLHEPLLWNRRRHKPMNQSKKCPHRRIQWTRRKFLSLTTACLSFLSFIRPLRSEEFNYRGNPFRDRFQSFRQTFRVEPDRAEAERIVRHILRGRNLRTNLIRFDAPDIAENGSAVPIKIFIDCLMTETDFPTIVHVLALENPFPEIAKYRFTPECGKAQVTSRIRMRATAPIVVIAEMIDGTVGMTEKTVSVTLGACS